jgi:thiamine pyrophosphokinase
MWCVIVASAPLRPTAGLIARLAGAERVLAADGGAATALTLRLRPDLVLGDLDSLGQRVQRLLRRQGVAFELHPTDKDATDGELALWRALAWGATTITIVGGLGGPRLDHGLANILLLGREALAGRRVTLLDNRNEVRLLRDGEAWRWVSQPGEIVSLLPLFDDVAGVTTEGLRWPLHQATLTLASTRAVSNEALANQAGVRVGTGRLLVTRSLPPTVADWPVSAERVADDE